MNRRKTEVTSSSACGRAGPSCSLALLGPGYLVLGGSTAASYYVMLSGRIARVCVCVGRGSAFRRDFGAFASLPSWSMECSGPLKPIAGQLIGPRSVNRRPVTLRSNLSSS